MSRKKERKFGAICNAGGRDLEIVSEHQAWLDWALDALYAKAEQEAKLKRPAGSGGSVECPHCHWGFAPSVIDQHISEKHGGF